MVLQEENHEKLMRDRADRIKIDAASAVIGEDKSQTVMIENEVAGTMGEMDMRRAIVLS